MKILLDTNVIVDKIAAREPYKKQADEIIRLIACKRVEGFLTTSSVTDIYYIVRKTLSDVDSRESIRGLLYLLNEIEVSKNDCFKALDSPMPDFEDALLSECANKANVDYIVTRDEKFLNYPKTIRPEKLLELI